MRASRKLQNSIQILIILWLVYPIHTNSLFKVIFEEPAFYHFPNLNTSVLGKDSQILLIFHSNVLVFQTNGKQPYSFPVLSRMFAASGSTMWSYPAFGSKVECQAFLVSNQITTTVFCLKPGTLQRHHPSMNYMVTRAIALRYFK